MEGISVGLEAVLQRDESGNPIVVDDTYQFVTSENFEFHVPIDAIYPEGEYQVINLYDEETQKHKLVKLLLDGLNDVDKSSGDIRGKILKTSKKAVKVKASLDVSKAEAESDANIEEWTEAPCVLLIDLYKKYKLKVESRKITTLKKMWQIISSDMNDQGHNFTPMQVENKWKTLKRAYRRMLEHNATSERGRKSCPYEKELVEIIGKTRTNIYPNILGNGTTRSKKMMLANFGLANSQRSSATRFTGFKVLSKANTSRGVAQSSRNGSRPSRPTLRSNTVLYEVQQVRKSIVEMRQKRDEAKANIQERRLKIMEQRNEYRKVRNELLTKIFDFLKDSYSEK